MPAGNCCQLQFGRFGSLKLFSIFGVHGKLNWTLSQVLSFVLCINFCRADSSTLTLEKIIADRQSPNTTDNV